MSEFSESHYFWRGISCVAVNFIFSEGIGGCAEQQAVGSESQRVRRCFFFSVLPEIPLCFPYFSFMFSPRDTCRLDRLLRKRKASDDLSRGSGSEDEGEDSEAEMAEDLRDLNIIMRDDEDE